MQAAFPDRDIYARPRHIADDEMCLFYHTMDIPEYGHFDGWWDLRGRERDYLGDIDFDGKRVLEMGAASGFLTFFMERQGADVVAFDLSEDYPWDIVPFANVDTEQVVRKRKVHAWMQNNGFWFAHRAFASRARVVYGTVPDVPTAIGPVDIATFGAILLHVRDPFRALANVWRLTRETVIVADLYPFADPPLLPDRSNENIEPSMVFMPRHRGEENIDMWWQMRPALVREFLGTLGFAETTTFYEASLNTASPPITTPKLIRDGAGGEAVAYAPILMYTVVGRRTTPMHR